MSQVRKEIQNAFGEKKNEKKKQSVKINGTIISETRVACNATFTLQLYYLIH